MIPSRTPTQLTPYRSRNTALLTSLRNKYEETSAIELLYKQHPDVSKAVQNFLRLANDGHKMKFYSPRGIELERVEKEWNEQFAPRVNQISNAGLDGLVDMAHKSAILFGAMGTEIEPNSDLTDVIDIHPVDPRWISWEHTDRWRPFQYHNGEKVYVDSPNFCWIPIDPDIEDPRGNLMFAPAIFAIDTQLQALSDVAAVIHKIGYPREDISIKLETLLPIVKAGGALTQEQIQEGIKKYIGAIYDQYDNLQPDSTFIHTDDLTYNITKGANERGGVDVRAVNEFLDLFVLNGLQQMGVFQNRTSGITETWGTVQFKIFVGVVNSLRRASKRLVESNARIWARVRGYQARPVFTPDPIDWEAEETRWIVKTLEQAWNKVNEDQGWVDADEAAENVVGHGAEGRKQNDNNDDSDSNGSLSRNLRQVQIERVLRRQA